MFHMAKIRFICHLLNPQENKLSPKNSGFRQFSRGLFVGLFESRFCSHELTHLSLIVSFLRSWFLSVAN